MFPGLESIGNLRGFVVPRLPGPKVSELSAVAVRGSARLPPSLFGRTRSRLEKSVLLRLEIYLVRRFTEPTDPKCPVGGRYFNQMVCTRI